MLLMFFLIVAISGAAVYEAFAADPPNTGAPSTVAVEGMLISPETMTLTVGGDPVPVTARVIPDNATNKNVIWSVSGTYVTLYADRACTTPVSSPTSLLTVYAKATAVGDGAMQVTSVANPAAVMYCIFEVKPTVTYKPGDEATGTEQTVTVTKNEQGTYTHPIQKYEDSFTAPAGKRFDHWDDGKGNTYKYGDTIDPVTENITLTAIWVDEPKPDSGSGGGSGSFVDLVFNIPGADDSWEYVGGGYVPQRAYRVSLAPMQGGSAALGLTTGDSGTALNVYPTSAVYVFPNADPGYTLDKIVWSLIDGSASYDITEAKNFVMPAMDVVVYVTFRPVG